MKQHITTLLLATLTIGFASAQSGTINLNGKTCPIDTTEHYQVGPGIWYTAFTLNISGTKHNCYILETDLTNPYNTVEEYQSSSQMGSTEKLTSASKQLDAPLHHTIGGVNCNFWVVSSQDVGETQGMVGQPFAGTARNGVLIGEPSNWNAGHGDRGYVMLDRNKQLYIDNMDFAGTLYYNEQQYNLRDVNRPRVNPSDNEITLFNHYLGSKPTRTTDGIEIVFKTDDWRINGTFNCEVTAVNTSGNTLLTEGMGALQGRGSGKDFLSAMQVGNRFQINLGVISTNNPQLQPDIMQMVTGNALLLVDGQQTNRNTNEGYNNQNYPRTLLATNAQHNRLWMFVAEKPGMYTADMCAILQQCGAAFAAGMDGGGSAQMCLFGNILNPTTEGTPRAVANSLWVLSTAPDDPVITALSTSVTTIVLPKYGTFRPTFKGYNQYGVLVDPDVQDVTLACDESTGYIDSQGRFVCLGAGLLHATCQNAVLDIRIQIDNTASPSIRLDSVLVSDDTDYAIEV
ncbi:MAG: phosphodiester glycosidase family protein, partial [Prevotella sp.]|nr:phosphodiester glycosidase family protein [Bacteroidales bacterium]MCM1069400.1 phosphodiester glycosidase family protein [Prevotella sp.]MCM1577106.1 phosphodiester glycosidase family protein [Bacteroides sp.]